MTYDEKQERLGGCRRGVFCKIVMDLCEDAAAGKP
jgi:hypothetical protein